MGMKVLLIYPKYLQGPLEYVRKFAWLITSLLCVSLLSHDRYQYDNQICSENTPEHGQVNIRNSCCDALF
jgi:hypothetical protein